VPLQRAEVGVASHLLRLLKGDLPWGVIDSTKLSPGSSSGPAGRSHPHSGMPSQWPWGVKSP
jgi:hypothetical protein